MELKEITIAALHVLKEFYNVQLDMINDGQQLIQAKPSDVNSADFWKHWITEIVDPENKSGYADNWEAIFIRIMQLV